tara:strand:+ start:11440 stop:11838 length:399 start_codon:yes stop_codon:yes gene_type:complete
LTYNIIYKNIITSINKTGKKMLTLLQNTDKTETGYEIGSLLSRGTLKPKKTDGVWTKEYVWKSEYFKHFQPVAFIDTNDLDEAFHFHNIGRSDKVDKIVFSHHSMSIGDLLKNSEGEVFMVEPAGFTKIETA